MLFNYVLRSLIKKRAKVTSFYLNMTNKIICCKTFLSSLIIFNMNKVVFAFVFAIIFITL